MLPEATSRPPARIADPAADRLGVGQNVRAEEDGRAPIAQAEDELPHVAASERVQPRHRFVEEYHLGIVDERLGDADSLQHALGEAPQLEPPLLANLDEVEQAGHAGLALGPVVAEQPGEIA